jgi:ABC-type glycerol-3-phosphate transport system substrate-binding protein
MGAGQDFEREHPDIKVVLEPVPFPQHVMKFVAQTKANQAPDLFRCIDGGAASIMGMGAAHPIDPLIQKYGGGRDLKEQLEPSLMPLATYKGVMYGMPAWASPLMQVYDTELFRKAGLNPDRPPRTFPEFLDAVQKLTQKDASGKTVQWGYLFRGEKTVTSTLRLVSWWLRNGARILSEDNTRAVLNSPAGKETFRFLVELHTKYHVIPPGIPEVGGNETNTLFGTQKVAIAQLADLNVGILETQHPGTKARTALAPMPGKVQTTTVMAGVFFISANTKHPKEAWELFKYQSRKESQLKVFTAGGWVPTRKDAFAAPEVTQYKYGPLQAEALKTATLLPPIPEWPQISDILMETFHTALAEKGNPDALLDKAADRINQVLKK